MASAGRTTTQLDIKVNARELNRLDAKLRDTFKGSKTKDFNRQLEGLTKIVEKSVSSFKKLNQELAGAKDGARHYKKLADELRIARKEAEGLAAALGRGRGGGGSGGGRGGGGSSGYIGGGGFAGSRYQGGGGGQRQRQGGGGSGGWFGGGSSGGSRGRNNSGGLGSTQLKNPSLGTYGSMFSGLPVFGAAIAGMVQMQQGFYQSHLQKQRSRFNTHAFLSGTQDGFGADLGISPKSQVGASSVSQGAISAALLKEQERVRSGVSGGGLTMDRKKVKTSPGAPAKYGWITQKYTETHQGKWATHEIEKTRKVMAITKNAVAPTYETVVDDWSAKQRDKLTGLTPSAIKQVESLAASGASAKAIDAKVSTLKKDATNLSVDPAEIAANLRKKARAAAGWKRTQKRSGVSDLTRVGQKYGYAAPQALQRANQMTSAYGDRVSGDQYEFGEAMRAGFGLDITSTGGLMKGMEGAYGGRGGDQSGGRSGVTDLLANAVKAGMGRAEVTEHLKRISTITQAQYRLGMKGMNTDFMTGNVRALSGAGITGIAASDTVTGFMKGASEQGYGGPKGAHGYALMRSAGWDPSQGTEGYFAAQEKLQALGAGSGNANIMKKYLKQHDPGSGKGGATRRHFIQEAFKGVGVRIGKDQAAKIAGLLDRGFSTDEDEDESSVTIKDVLKSGKGAKGRGTLAAEAGLENKRSALGARVAPQVREMMRTSLALAKTLSPVISTAMTGLNKLFGAGIKGLETLIDGIQKAITALAKLVP
jgi:hypothetical protein